MLERLRARLSNVLHAMPWCCTPAGQALRLWRAAWRKEGCWANDDGGHRSDQRWQPHEPSTFGLLNSVASTAAAHTGPVAGPPLVLSMPIEY